MVLSNFAQWATSFLLVGNVLAANVLVPIRPAGGRSSKRQETSGLELRNSETFLWADAATPEIAAANLTVYMPGDSEGIVSMERFDGMVTNVRCSQSQVEMTFRDDATFAYAQRVWDWVNGANNHSFVMIAGVGDCGNNTHRLPYVVSTLAYDEAANKATLAANLSDWKSVAHSYDFVVGSVAQPESNSNIERRDISKSTTIDFNHQLPFSIALGMNGLEGKIACTNCSSTGQFDMEFTITQKLFIPTGARMKISPRGVSAIAQIKVSGSGKITDAQKKEFDILEIPISALKIPGILDLGPFLTVSVGAELSSISLSAGVQTGAKASIDDAAILDVNLLQPDENKFSGWAPKVEMLETKVDASISGGVAVYLKPFVNLQAEVLGHGFALGVNMKVPNISAKLSAVASPQGACPAKEGEPKTTLGVSASINIGGSLNFEVKKTQDDDTLFTVQIAAIDKPLATICWPLGDAIQARAMIEGFTPVHGPRPAIAAA